MQGYSRALNCWSALANKAPSMSNRCLIILIIVFLYANNASFSTDNGGAKDLDLIFDGIHIDLSPYLSVRLNFEHN